MIPIRDDTPRYSTPAVTYFLIALNVVVFLFELSLPPAARNTLMFQFGFVPSHITGLLGGVPTSSVGGAFVPIFSSMFLHASWLHLIANMWVLWIFGDNIEDYLGHFRYLLFYLLSGLGAAVVHTALNLGSSVPSVGASGAIAGVMGAYFVLYPRARVLTIGFFIGWFPAWIVLGYWFVVQFLSGTATRVAYSNETGGVAFWAHVGGFITGIVLVKLIPARVRQYRYGTW